MTSKTDANYPMTSSGDRFVSEGPKASTELHNRSIQPAETSRPAADALPTQAPALAVTGQTWSAVGSMALCVALLIAAEFMPVSLLTPIAHDLGATVGMAGQ